MEVNADDQRRLNILARRAKKGDRSAYERIITILYPVLKSHAASEEFRSTNASGTDRHDFLQVGLMSIEESIEKWTDDGKPFFTYAIARAGYAAKKEKSENGFILPRVSIVSAVEGARRKLLKTLEREPDIEEIKEALAASSVGSIRADTIIAAIEACRDPRHLDHVAVLNPDVRGVRPEAALEANDEYFPDDAPSLAEQAENEKLRALIGTLNARLRRLMLRFIETEGDFELLAEEFNYPSAKAARDAVNKQTAILVKLDEKDPRFIARSEQHALREQARKNPLLLRHIAPKARVYFDLALEDYSASEIAVKCGVTFASVNQSLTGVYGHIGAKHCNKCGIEKLLTDFHVRTKNGKKGRQPYCRECKSEMDKAYAAKKVAKKMANRQIEKEAFPDRALHQKIKKRTHKQWKEMIYRCEDPASSHYEDFGGAGITVCGRWHAYPLFLTDMGPVPSDKHMLTMIDQQGNYEPENCRWESYAEREKAYKTATSTT